VEQQVLRKLDRSLVSSLAHLSRHSRLLELIHHWIRVNELEKELEAAEKMQLIKRALGGDKEAANEAMNEVKLKCEDAKMYMTMETIRHLDDYVDQMADLRKRYNQQG